MNRVRAGFSAVLAALLSGLVFASPVLAAAETAGGAAEAETRITESGSAPTAAFDAPSGTLYLAWVRPGKTMPEVVVARSEDGGRTLSEPVLASGSDTAIVTSSVNPPHVAVGPEGRVYVLYDRSVPSPHLEAGVGIPRLARSTDGGRTFAPAIDVAAADGVESSAAMTDLSIAADGPVSVAWLDYRAVLAWHKLPEYRRPEDVGWKNSDDAKIEVRIARSTDGGQPFGPSVLIATDASERSRVALTRGPDGALYASWRSKLNQLKGSYDAVRDVLVSASPDGGATWSQPVKVHDDRFKSGDCPEIAHGIAAHAKGRLHVGWYTGTGVAPGVYYANSDDRGQNFSKPLALLTDAWVPYADVKLALDGRGSAWVAFEDRRDDRSEAVRLVRIDASGVVSPPQSWPGTSPDLAAHGETAILVYADAAGAVRLVRASVP